MIEELNRNILDAYVVQIYEQNHSAAIDTTTTMEDIWNWYIKDQTPVPFPYNVGTGLDQEITIRFENDDITKNTKLFSTIDGSSEREIQYITLGVIDPTSNPTPSKTYKSDFELIDSILLLQKP